MWIPGSCGDSILIYFTFIIIYVLLTGREEEMYGTPFLCSGAGKPCNYVHVSQVSISSFATSAYKNNSTEATKNLCENLQLTPLRKM